MIEKLKNVLNEIKKKKEKMNINWKKTGYY